MKGLPEDQQEMILKAFEKDPAFFKKIAEEIKTQTKNGKSQAAASREVMMRHKDKLRDLMM